LFALPYKELKELSRHIHASLIVIESKQRISSLKNIVSVHPTFTVLAASLVTLFILTGCSEHSEWDQQWDTIQNAIHAGDLAQAKTQLHTILPSIQDNGPTDERYGQVIYQLGDIARLEGDFNQAESYYWKALPLIGQSLGPEHPHMADPLTELATIYEHKAQPKVALPLLKRALAIREKAWGDSSRHLLPTLKHYHLLLMLNDHHEEAVQILGRISRLEQAPS
jgi:tetratricopeptide (TPR) repeat protein